LLDGFRQPYASYDSNLHPVTRGAASTPLPPMEKPLRAFAWGMSSVASTALTLVLFWPGNGGSVDCRRRIIRYCPAAKEMA
jgi:hypothetical protein